ncbi:MAG TPA: hypothetical protein VL832_04485 [Puia sp.]|nr:hypothetical protein [Puia sp.]
MLKPLRLLLIAVIFLGTGCGKKEKDPCKDIYCFDAFTPYLRLRIIDRQTDSDWVFSATPRYPASAIHVSNPADTTTWRVYPDSSAKPPFLFTAFGPEGELTLYIRAGDAKPDTFQCNIAYFSQGCCSTGAKTTHARLNGQLLYNDRLDTTMLIIKK